MDIGAIDSAGITRHIVRDVEPVATLQGAREDKDWRWFLETLCRTLRRHGTSAIENGRVLSGIPLPETVLFENDVPTSWAFETLDGTLALRPSNLCVMDVIRKRFRSGAGHNAPQHVAVALYRDGSRRVLSVEDLQTPRTTDRIVSLQLYITPKASVLETNTHFEGLLQDDHEATKGGGDPEVVNFRHDFLLQPDGRPCMHSFRLGAPIALGANGKPQREAIRSRNGAINGQMDAASRAVVRALESTSRYRVISVSSEFLLDVNDRLWLIGIRNMSVTEETGGSRPGSGAGGVFEPTPTDFKPPSNFEQRKLLAQEAELKNTEASANEEKVVLRDLGLDGSAGLTDIADMALLRTGKRKVYMTSREVRRSEAVKDKFTQKATQQFASQASPGIEEDQEIESAMQNEQANREDLKREKSSYFRGMAGFDRQDFAKTIGNTLEASHGKALDSSQTLLCPGDFCDVEFKIGFGELDANEQSMLQRRMLLEDPSAGILVDGKEAPGTNTTVRGARVHPVTFRSIVQTRNERKLVELLIRRLEKGEKGDYVQSVADLESSRLGYTFPNHYYKEVRVCPNCFKIYSTVEHARNRAIDKLDPKHAEVQARLAERQLEKQVLKEEAKAAEKNRHEVGPIYIDRRVNPFTPEGKKLMDSSFSELRQLALQRAEQAIQALTKASLAELRSFQKPPLGVIQVAHALMLLLTGKSTSWDATKSIMANGERITSMMRDFDMDCIPPQRIADLESFLKDPFFRPSSLLNINKAAAILCEFVLGAIMAHKYKAGTAHPRGDPLLFLPADAHTRSLAENVEKQRIEADEQQRQNDTGTNAGNSQTPEKVAKEGQESCIVELPAYLRNTMQLQEDLKSIARADADVAPLHDKLEQQRKRQRKGTRPRTSYSKSTREDPAVAAAEENSTRPTLALSLSRLNHSSVQGSTSDPIMSPTGLSYVQHKSMSGTAIGFNRHTSDDSMLRNKLAQSTPQIPYVETVFDKETLDALRKKLDQIPDANASSKMSKMELRARRKVQEKQMQRLHAGGQGQELFNAQSDLDLESSAKTVSSKTFVCSDGKTTLSYDIVGTGGLESSTPNLVVVQDMFDTCESLQIFLEPLMRKYYGSQALVFNYPGQAYTRFPAETAGVLNNEFIAATLHELLSDLEHKGDFCCSFRPFYLLGLGNGANIAAYFASEFGGLPEYGKCLRGLVSVNGFAHIDEQLAAILHSSVNIFDSFPPMRPDLPISYFSRFLFSDDYLQRVDPALVLNIYTAVGNPITLQGRSHLCQGILRHKDIRQHLRKLEIPLLVVQSTENALVNPTNVDPFIDGRTVFHLWSHQFLDSGKVGPKAVDQMKTALKRPDGAFVVWLKSGHEVRQESKAHILDLLDNLLSSSATLSAESGGQNFAAGLHASKRAEEISKTTSLKRQAQSKKYRQEQNQQSHHRRGRPMEDGTCRDEDEESKIESHLTERGKKKRHRKDLTRSVDKDIPQHVSNNVTSPQARQQSKDADVAQLEFEEAMRRHRETKRLAEEARQVRLAELEELSRQEEERLRQERELAEFEIARRDEEARNDLEMELDERRRQHEENMRQLLEDKEREMLAEVEAERARARELSDNLEKQLAKEQAIRNKLVHGGMDMEVVIQKVQEPRDPDLCSPIAIMQSNLELQVQRQIEHLKREQEERRRKWEEEDRRKIEELERQLLGRQLSREKSAEQVRVASGADTYSMQPRSKMEEKTDRGASREAPEIQKDSSKRQSTGDNLGSPKKDIMHVKPASVKATEENKVNDALQAETKVLDESTTDSSMQQPVLEEQTAAAKIDAAIADAEAALPKVERVDLLDQEAYDQIQREMEAEEDARAEKEEALRKIREKELREIGALEIQRLFRGRTARMEVIRMKQERMANDDKYQAAIRIQALQRGRMGRERAEELRAVAMRDREEARAVVEIQRVGRGMLGRGRVRVLKQERAATKIQSMCRMYLAKRILAHVRAERARIIREGHSATKIQSVWRMWRGREEFLHHRILNLAALQIQRVYRGVRGRRRAQRKRTWENAEPGPERLELGLALIEDSKAAFSAQQEEIDALHRAQERAETRVSQVHAGLQESERELAVLEQELRDVDHLDETLHQLTHEKALFDARAEIAEREARARKGSSYDPGLDEDARKRAAESYALEMQIHIKRAERERKKKELEAEFAAVFQEVEAKKSELRALEHGIEDMESTRKRKEREFQRLQRSLMELLEEQKAELDSLREKGIELESATATSAAAAAATAAAAKENEERSKQMFASTEELLKFQFMSMSLSYFSSINMLKNLRDINSDTTQQAISSSADTAAAAAAAAQAANIDSVGNIQLGSSGAAQAKLKEKQAQIRRQKEVEDAAKLLKEPFPDDVRLWTVQDVGRWLDTLSLGYYKNAFADACIDGEFLMELRVEDMRDILGMRHALHVQKLDFARNKLRPLNEREERQKRSVEWENKVAESRQGGGGAMEASSEDVPEVDTVFSQIRNGRYNRVEKALDMGFDPNETDSHGNTSLIIACQNLNKRIAELLLRRGANVNHQNSQGNTAMHFAFSYDVSQESGLGELLIGHGADDSIENRLGLSCYDGIE